MKHKPSNLCILLAFVGYYYEEMVVGVYVSVDNINLFLCFKVFLKKIDLFYFFLYFKLIFLVFLDHFNTLMLKII